MRINSTNQTIFSSGINISTAANQERRLLFNELLDIKRKLKIPITFKNYEIILPSVTDNVIAELNKLNIKYSKF